MRSLDVHGGQGERTGEGTPAEPTTLEARGVTVEFEGLTALSNVDVIVRPREIIGLIGPNGAGKTTLLNVISGFQEPTHGRVSFHGADVTKQKPHSRARLGLGRSFQGTRLFGNLTVLENVEAAGVATGLRRADARERGQQLLDRVGLVKATGQVARSLPAGDQRRLGLARALALDPSFLLLDEPAAGLNEAESSDLVSEIRQIRTDFGCGVLIIDHDMSVIMPLCDRIQVLNEGRTIAFGTSDEVRADPGVAEAYLGIRD